MSGTTRRAPIKTWDELIEVLGPVMLDEADEDRLRGVLCEQAFRHLLSMDDGGWDSLLHPITTVYDDSWGKVLVQLRALGVITTGAKKRGVSDKGVYWRLTPAGDRQLVRLKAIVASAGTPAPRQ